MINRELFHDREAEMLKLLEHPNGHVRLARAMAVPIGRRVADALGLPSFIISEQDEMQIAVLVLDLKQRGAMVRISEGYTLMEVWARDRAEGIRRRAAAAS